MKGKTRYSIDENFLLQVWRVRTLLVKEGSFFPCEIGRLEKQFTIVCCACLEHYAS